MYTDKSKQIERHTPIRMRTPRTSQTNIRQVVADYQRVTQTGNEYDRKQVYQVRCGHCDCGITNRGMNAVLLSDRAIQLFSTDLMPNTLGFVHGDYCAASCSCRVRDTACLKCGNVVGYHVNVPCKTCLSQPNNGHYWMFRSADVRPLPLSCQIRVGDDRKCHEIPLIWGFVHGAGEFVNHRYFRQGDMVAAQDSCELSVTLPGNVPVVTPTKRSVYARTLDSERGEDYVTLCR